MTELLESGSAELVHIQRLDTDWLLDFFGRHGDFTGYRNENGWTAWFEPRTELPGFCPKVSSDYGMVSLSACLNQIYQRFQRVRAQLGVGDD